jgi:sugar lactone lactonase YvrE
MKAILLPVLLLAPLGALHAASKSHETAKVPMAGGVSACDAIPIAEAHYSFGTTVARVGTVLFTEFNHREIKSWNPIRGCTDVWRAKQTSGMYGLTANKSGDVFVGLDLGDNGNPGKVLRIKADGTEAYIVESITRPRQLACDVAGNLFIVLEGGKILKWDHASGTTSELMSAQPPVTGIAIGPDGSVYVSEYATFKQMDEGYSRPEASGVVKVRRPDGTITVLASGFWRARGLALSGTQLYLCTEANREDHGNSGLLVRIDTLTGAQETLLAKLDYPQFPATDAQGRVYFTLGRDNKLMRYDPASLFKVVPCPAPEVQRALVRGGHITWAPSPGGTSFSIQSKNRTLQGSLQLDERATSMDVYLDVPANCFDLNPCPLYHVFNGEHPSPGIFELPSARATCASGTITVVVLPVRCHQGKRWPMQNAGTPTESPAPGFSEHPEAFRFYFHWTPFDRKNQP